MVQLIERSYLRDSWKQNHVRRYVSILTLEETNVRSHAMPQKRSDMAIVYTRD